LGIYLKFELWSLTFIVGLPVESLKVERKVFRLKTEGEREPFFEHRMMKSLRSASL